VSAGELTRWLSSRNPRFEMSGIYIRYRGVTEQATQTWRIPNFDFQKAILIITPICLVLEQLTRSHGAEPRRQQEDSKAQWPQDDSGQK